MPALTLLKSLLPFRGRKRTAQPAAPGSAAGAPVSGGAPSADARLAALSQASRGETAPQAQVSREKTAPREQAAPREKVAPRDRVAPRRPAAPREQAASREPSAPRERTAAREPAAPREHSAPRRPRSAGNEPDVHPAQALGIERRRIHPHVLHVVLTLQQQGFPTLVVGGAVRDLLLGRTPKDFDVVTAARPEQVRRIFRNARIIGRRFRLCLLRFGAMQVEVSTFRGLPERTQRGGAAARREPTERGQGMIRRDNTFGTPREDAFRRDFTINALALDPQRMEVLDYVGGLEDLRARRIRTISAPAVSFAEDPVRMLRALRFLVRLDFALDPALQAALKTHARGLAEVKRHRLADETQRFLVSGFAERVFEQFQRWELLEPLLGLQAAQIFDPRAAADPLPALRPFLQGLERWVAEGREPLPPTVALLGLVVTLARPELRGHLLGARPGPGGHSTALRRSKRSLPRQLVDWGLLRGQMEPALRILATARLLLRYRHGAAPQRRRRLGEREAWLLLGILQPVLGLPAEFVRQGLERVPDLPDLPILDHPRPTRRGATTSGSDAESGRDTGVASFDEGQDEPGSGRKRRRRRRRRSPGHRAARAAP